MEQLHILQIMPALPGWKAVWAEQIDDDELQEGSTGYYMLPVVCWALIEDGNEKRFVTALTTNGDDSKLELVTQDEDFLGYSIPDDSESPNWSLRASTNRTLRAKLRTHDSS